MKQVFVSGGGEVGVFEVPAPAPVPNGVVVQTDFSAISTGTEGSMIASRPGWLGVLEKATASPRRVRQVVDLARAQGALAAWERVRQKVGEWIPAGYSTSGRVIEAVGNAGGLTTGQLVAGVGVGWASHAEYVTLPRNLVAAVPPSVPADVASLGALGCIAMQGLRRLETGPGERIGVIGLGVIGQLVLRLAARMGYVGYGLDIRTERVECAREVLGVHAWTADDGDVVERVRELTEGHGLDGVVVCAASESSAAANLALDLCRHRGRVSIVGDVGLDLDRAKMYRKELEVRLSAAYGPGRYDPEYEIEGRDYPFGLVRWTVKRNLELFLNLVGQAPAEFEQLVSGRFPIAAAAAAYARVKEARSRDLCFVFDYGAGVPGAHVRTAAVRTLLAPVPTAQRQEGRVRLALVGVGQFVRGVHIPNLRRLQDRFAIAAVVSQSGSAGPIGQQLGARIISTDPAAVFADENVDAVLVATRHASHADLVLGALHAGKHVFVEKPMALTVAECRAIEQAASEANRVVRVGFNRRFAPYLRWMRSTVGKDGRRLFQVRVNVGPVRDHWSSQGPEGGRLLGEGVHFVDLCNWFIGSAPVAVSATFMGSPEDDNPNAVLTLRYEDGSAGTVSYTTLGSARTGKEWYEAFGNGRAAQCDDLRSAQGFGTAGPSRKGRGDKGQLAELAEFADAVQGRGGGEGADARAGTLATWAIVAGRESAREGREVPWLVEG